MSGTVAIFEPAEPAPAQAPVVVFTQGVGPDDYQGWIEHLVGRGSIVVFQNLPFQGVSVDERRGGAAAGLRAALRELARRGHVRPRPDSLVGLHAERMGLGASVRRRTVARGRSVLVRLRHRA